MKPITAPLAIEAHDVHFAYPDGIAALAGVSFRAYEGEFLAVMGANGSGKTTLLKVLMRLLQPQLGEVRLATADIRRLPSTELYRRVGMIFQHPADQLFGASVEEDVAFGPRNLGLSKTDVAERVEQSLAAMDILELRRRPIHHLSYGQQKRVCLAGVLAMQPGMLLLDEPTAGLDPLGETQMIELLLRLNRQQKTTLDCGHPLRRPAAGAGRPHLRAGRRPRAPGRLAPRGAGRSAAGRRGRPADSAGHAVVPSASRAAPRRARFHPAHRGRGAAANLPVAFGQRRPDGRGGTTSMSLRSGITTGACAAAAAKAAATVLAGGAPPREVDLRLPSGNTIRLPILYVESRENPPAITAAVRKDAGDDPDVTDGLEVRATLSWNDAGETIFAAGEGVGTVTKPGLQVPPGEPAINPVPRQMIQGAIREVTRRGVSVEISIPGGGEIAAQTFNPRLGIVGGLSVLGTTGIVRPYCTRALHERSAARSTSPPPVRSRRPCSCRATSGAGRATAFRLAR